jgi:hypothetical protein
LFIMNHSEPKEPVAHYLVFGDLHGRILPAFRLAAVWSREHGVPLTGILQVGDLGWFPDLTRLDKATKRHAEKDPLELGATLVVEPSPLADQIFEEEHVPSWMWFIAGNHEDYESLAECQSQASQQADSFPVDAYHRVWCIRDGRVAHLPGGLAVGGLWGIDQHAPNARRGRNQRCYITSRAATELSVSAMDVLLMHDGPLDAVFPGSGSEWIRDIIQMAQPQFAFFGHYGGDGHRIEGNFGRTQVCHLAGLEMHRQGGRAEPGSVGLLTWDGIHGTFDYLDDAWLRTFTRNGWKYR